MPIFSVLNSSYLYFKNKIAQTNLNWRMSDFDLSEKYQELTVLKIVPTAHKYVGPRLSHLPNIFLIPLKFKSLVNSYVGVGGWSTLVH